MATGTKTTKSASPKVNASKTAEKTAEQKAAAVARRQLNVNVTVDADIPIPAKVARSKYPFEALTFKGMSFKLEECMPGNAAAIKTTAKSKFGMKLLARPDGTGYRFWRTDGMTQAEAEAAAKSADAPKDSEQKAA